MARVHEILRWASKREVAREVTRRGYRVSGETLNKWVREEKEFPAVVERIVFDLFTIGHEEAAPPTWAERLLESLFVWEHRAEVTDEELVEAQARVAAFLAVAHRKRQPPASSSGGGGAAS